MSDTSYTGNVRLICNLSGGVVGNIHDEGKIALPDAVQRYAPAAFKHRIQDLEVVLKVQSAVSLYCTRPSNATQLGKTSCHDTMRGGARYSHPLHMANSSRSVPAISSNGSIHSHV